MGFAGGREHDHGVAHREADEICVRLGTVGCPMAEWTVSRSQRQAHRLCRDHRVCERECPHGDSESTVILEVATLISMGDSEAGASGWPSMGRPGQADGGRPAVRAPKAQHPDADSWRSVFDELWSRLALSMVGEPHAHRLARALAAVWAIDERLREGAQEQSFLPDR